MRVERDGWSAEAAKKKGRDPPDWYYEPPPEPAGVAMFYEAYRDLSTERADGPIPWSACQRYAREKGMDRGVADLLWDVIRKMDLAERRWHVDNMKADAGE